MQRPEGLGSKAHEMVGAGLHSQASSQDLGSIKASPPKSCRWSPLELGRPHHRSRTWCGRGRMDRRGAAVSRLCCSCAGEERDPGDEGHGPHAPLQAQVPTCCGDEGFPGKALPWNGDFLLGTGSPTIPRVAPRVSSQYPSCPHPISHSITSPSPLPQSILQLQCGHLS